MNPGRNSPAKVLLDPAYEDFGRAGVNGNAGQVVRHKATGTFWAAEHGSFNAGYGFGDSYPADVVVDWKRVVRKKRVVAFYEERAEIGGLNFYMEVVNPDDQSLGVGTIEGFGRKGSMQMIIGQSELEMWYEGNRCASVDGWFAVVRWRRRDEAVVQKAYPVRDLIVVEQKP